MSRRQGTLELVGRTVTARRHARSRAWCVAAVATAAALPTVGTAAPESPASAVQLSHFELEALHKWPRPDILPDDRDVQAMLRAGRPYVFATARMCIDRAGVPTTVELLERSGFSGCDTKLVAKPEPPPFDPQVLLPTSSRT